MKIINQKCQSTFFEQFLKGKSFDIKLNHLEEKDIVGIQCPKCEGRGWIEEDGIDFTSYDQIVCPNCVEGVIPGMNKEDFQYQIGDTLWQLEYIPIKCPKCDGDGFVNGDYCESGRYNHIDCLNCNGMGKIWEYTNHKEIYKITFIMKINVKPITSLVERIDRETGIVSNYNHEEYAKVLIDNNDFWTPEEIAKYGLVVIGMVGGN